MDTLLYDLSIPAISSLQGTLSKQANYMQAISVIFDPKYAFLIYSPIAFMMDKQVGKKLILTTVIAEWLNMILKWLLHGERPYWYVHSSGHFNPQQVPIQQFPITCELGPGHPSGHAMVTAAVWYIILDSILKLYQTHIALNAPPKGSEQDLNETTTLMTTQPSTTSGSTTQAKLSIWTLYAILLITVSVSRVFLGCHFPHQCLAGALLGLLLARWISKHESKATHFIGASFVLLTTAFGTFAILQALGFDPSWTIKLATKHCVKREYIHLDTAPFFSIMRYCGFALGTGLGLMFPLKNVAKQLVPAESHIIVAGSDKESKNPLSSRNLSWFSFKIVMALLMARLVDNLGLFVSPTYLPLYYSSAYFAYTLFSYAFVNL